MINTTNTTLRPWENMTLPTPPAPEPATAPATPTPWVWGVYEPTDNFKSIPEMVCICLPDSRMLIAACGKAGDPASEQDAEFICRAVNDYEAVKTHVANLEQENTELHELIGTQRQMIDTLQRQARKLRLSLIKAQGTTSLLLAALSIEDDEAPAY